MNKLALEPSETLETSSYMIGGVEPPAVQGFMIPMNCLGGNWRVCEPGLNPWAASSHRWNTGATDEEHPADSRRVSSTQGRGAQAELKSSLQTTFIYGPLPVPKGLSGSKWPLVPPQLGKEGLSSDNAPNSPACFCTGLVAKASWGDVCAARGRSNLCLGSSCLLLPPNTRRRGDVTAVPHRCGGSVWDSGSWEDLAPDAHYGALVFTSLSPFRSLIYCSP